MNECPCCGGEVLIPNQPDTWCNYCKNTGVVKLWKIWWWKNVVIETGKFQFLNIFY